MQQFRRIAILGPTGAGKTTLARQLSRTLGLPALELDALYHQEGWVPAPVEDFRSAVAAFLDAQKDGWVTDGNYGSALADLVLPQADMVIWLRPPFILTFTRLLRRTLRRLVLREVLWNGNKESWRKTFLSRDSLLLWAVTHWKPHRVHTRQRLDRYAPGVPVVLLCSSRDVSYFLEAFKDGTA